MPGYFITLVVLVLVLCALLTWIAVLDRLEARRIARIREVTVIRDESEQTVSRLNRAYGQALRDIQHPRPK